MVKISDIVEPLYREYVSTLEATGLTLDLDLKNPTTEVKSPQTIEFELKKYLEWAASRGHRQGNIIISDKPNQIIVKDSSAVLSPDEKQLFTSKLTSVKSRVGFGTTFSIALA